jgi:transketolase
VTAGHAGLPLLEPSAGARAPSRPADALRLLAQDAVAAAGSGDAGFALRMAEAAAALWTGCHKFDAGDPHWPDRDRFVLSAGHGAVLLHALLHLTGHDGMAREDLARFRRLHAPSCGQPDRAAHPAIEATTGPPGQGLANGVGMALTERLLAARFGRSLVDHRTWVLCGADELACGLSQEAACLAGRLRLHKLTVLLDADAAADEAIRCFAAHGWATRLVDGGDTWQIDAALAMAQRARKPTLIACRGAAAEGEPWASPAPFHLPDALARQWRAAGTRGAAARRGWLKRLARHPRRAEFERLIAGRLPDGLHERMAGLKAQFTAVQLVGGTAGSTERANRLAVETLSACLPELVGASALPDAAAGEMPPILAETFAGRHLHCGACAHGMAAVLNGMALHGGIVAYGEAALLAADTMRPALRLAALSRLRVIHVAVADSIALGADGPAAQPVEQLAGLRALPGLHVFRPADATETAECWDLALRRTDGPSLIALSGRPGAAAPRPTAEHGCARGGYVRALPEGARTPRQATLIASGSEVGLALAARALLATEGIAVAVVSLPCWELFAAQDEGYRAGVLGTAPRFGIEAASGFGWERWLGAEGVFIGLAGFGASGTAEELYRHFALTPEAVAGAVRRALART